MSDGRFKQLSGLLLVASIFLLGRDFGELLMIHRIGREACARQIITNAAYCARAARAWP